MNKRIIHSYGLLFLLASSSVSGIDQVVTPKFTIRSQSMNIARRMVGVVGQTTLYDMEKINGTFSITPEYIRSYRESDIAECLFGDALCGRTLRIQGSQVDARDPNALLADYFYLPTDFKSDVTFSPRIQNFLIDFHFYIGLDEWVQGLYFWIQTPVTYSKWDLNFCEKVFKEGQNDHCAGYFSPDRLERDTLLNSFGEYAEGLAPNTATQTATDRSGTTPAPAGDSFTINFNGLSCAKMQRCGSDTKTTVADIRLALGWNPLLEEDYHFGLNVQAALPTGNEVKPDLLFAAQNGNDKHWELGLGASGHVVLWRSEDGERHFGFYAEGSVTHMFKNKQCRCFDLHCKSLSRYMIAEKMCPTIQYTLRGTEPDIEPTAQFASVFAPVANITNLNVDVSVAAQGDVVAMLNYTSNGLSWDIGYEFWGHSCEKIKFDCCSPCKAFQENTWALKGDAQVFGFDVATGDNLTGAVPLSATQCAADIHGGKNFGVNGVTSVNLINAGKQNPNIDNPQLAQGDADNSGNPDNNKDLSTRPDQAVVAENPQINTSIQPKLITLSDINFARTKGISHKAFTHVSYQWTDKEDWTPYVGIGVEVEFGRNKSTCQTACDSSCNDTNCGDCNKCSGDCIRCSVSQWGLWVKGGASFN